MDKFSGIALILVGVIELSIDHANDRFVVLQVESQLLLPQPIVGISHTRLLQLFDHIHVVNSVHNQRFVLQIRDQTFGGRDIDRHTGVFLEHLFDLCLELLELAALQRFFASLREKNRLRETGDLEQRESDPMTRVPEKRLDLGRIFLHGDLSELFARVLQRTAQQLLQGGHHLFGQLLQPFFDRGGDTDLLQQWNQFAVQRTHADDVLIVLVEAHGMNAGEEFLQMRLNDRGVRRLAENLQQIVVADEVEARKDRTLLLKESSKCEKEMRETHFEQFVQSLLTTA